MSTKTIDAETEYGKWQVHTPESTLAELNEAGQSIFAEVWPAWGDEIPTKLRRKCMSPSFFSRGVHHRQREYLISFEFNWTCPRLLSSSIKQHLPRNVEREWKGVYRIFVPQTSISRCCARDATGTLYIGRAGSGTQSWSILRTRIQSMAKRNHHATEHWCFDTKISQTFPWKTVAIQWAYTTGERLDHKGEPIDEAALGERLLLAAYCDSFGELPPLNHQR